MVVARCISDKESKVGSLLHQSPINVMDLSVFNWQTVIIIVPIRVKIQNPLYKASFGRVSSGLSKTEGSFMSFQA